MTNYMSSKLKIIQYTIDILHHFNTFPTLGQRISLLSLSPMGDGRGKKLMHYFGDPRKEGH